MIPARRLRLQRFRTPPRYYNHDAERSHGYARSCLGNGRRAVSRVRDARAFAVDVVDALMARIRRRNPGLHAYIAVYEAERGWLRAADKAHSLGHRVGPLHGVPIAPQGPSISGGASPPVVEGWAERVSQVTATLAEWLIGAGMIVLGKTHTVEFAMGSWGTNTPWARRAIRGISRSTARRRVLQRSGVAVSAGLRGRDRHRHGGLGTDPGGLVRHRRAQVTAGGISTYGVLPLSSTLDTPGPLARSVEDAALIYRALSGPDPPRSPDARVDADRSAAHLPGGVEDCAWPSCRTSSAPASRRKCWRRTTRGERARRLGARIVRVEFPRR